MSANKFENQVQQKMDELRLQPTAQVWEEVERQIREKKRRRIIIFWFLFAGLLLSGGIAWWIMDQQGKQEIVVAAEKNEMNQQKNDGVVKDQQNNVNNPKNEIQENSNNVTQKATETFSIDTLKPPTKRKRQVQSGLIAERTGAYPQIKTAKDITDNIFVEQKNADITIQKNNPSPVVPDPVKEDIKMADTLNTIPTVKPAESKELIAINDKPDTLKEADSSRLSNTFPGANPEKNNQEKKKWEIGLSGAVGKSRLTDGKIGSFGAKSADAYSSPSTGSGTGGPLADSIPLSGTSIQVGVSAKRKLGKKTAFSIGLSFSSYATKQRVGTFKDSVVTINNDLRSQTSEGFYRPGSSTTYHNKYYYLQAPVLLHWQINKGDKLPPVTWENGLAPSLLLGSNALAYDKAARIFYKDKRIYNSFNLVYQTYLSTRLFEDRKHPLNAGIYYTYHFSMLQRISPPNYNYLSAYGIKLNWVIKK